MELKKLQKHVRTLAALEETGDLVISCYLNLESGETSYRNVLDERVRLLKNSLEGEELQSFEDALSRIEAFLKAELLPESKGAAIFSREGAKPFFLPLQFRVSLPNWIVVNTTPNIYHLVELKDTYHRFVVMLSNEKFARILEVNLGEVTRQMWLERPELRKRVGREWTKLRYQNYLSDRNEQFIKEKIKILEKLMSKAGHTHLILAGNPRISALVRKLLPKQLKNKLVDTVAASGSDRISDVVEATLSAFVNQEEKESQSMVVILQQEIYAHGLAAVGSEDSLTALQRGQADTLILLKDYRPPARWKCAACGELHFDLQKPPACHQCENPELRETDLKEEMVRLAEQSGCQVEVVNHSEFLMSLGGAGCLLRYHTLEQYSKV
jgi:peptide subunit release factor 1 (eRF1)